MIENLNSMLDPTCTLDSGLLLEFGDLWAEAQQLWDQFHDTPAFHGYVSADYLMVYQSLARLRGKVKSVEEKSVFGIVSIRYRLDLIPGNCRLR